MKFKDAEVIGIPTIVIVGRRLDEGIVEVRDRRSDDRDDVTLDEAVARISALALA